MSSRHSLRRWLSSWLVLALLFTQLATAAHACPMATAAMTANAAPGQGVESADAAAMPCAAMMAGTAGTPLDTEQPGLCLQHCQGGSQTVDNAHAASVPTPTLLPSLTVWVQEPACTALPTWAAHRRSRANAPPLPHSIAHCCYRI